MSHQVFTRNQNSRGSLSPSFIHYHLFKMPISEMSLNFFFSTNVYLENALIWSNSPNFVFRLLHLSAQIWSRFEKILKLRLMKTNLKKFLRKKLKLNVSNRGNYFCYTPTKLRRSGPTNPIINDSYSKPAKLFQPRKQSDSNITIKIGFRLKDNNNSM